jgi:tellurite resistance-related uncharacterized protein
MPIPDGFEPYRRTSEFTTETIPDALRSAHNTKPGVWGLIHVVDGQLLYRVLDPVSETVLHPGGPPGVIEPQVLHEVAPLGPVRFFVEFYREAERASA